MTIRGCFIAQNGFAPPGWVEIQRDDEFSRFETDEDAALFIQGAAGVQGLACLYELVGRDEERPGRFIALDELGDARVNGAWIVVVPEIIARLAGVE